MPKSITFFSRGKTPIYVNYVIAHNTRGRPTGRPYNEKSCRYAAAFFSMTTNDERIAARRCYGFTTNDERITIGDVMAEPLWINGKSFTAYGLVRRGRSLTSQTAFGGQLPYKGSLGRPVVNNGRYTQLVYEKWFCDL